LEEVFTANHLTDTDKHDSTRKYTNYTTQENQTTQNTAKQSNPGSMGDWA